MLLKAPSLSIDNETMTDLQILFNSQKHQARFKGKRDDKEHDVVVISYHDPTINGLGFSIDKIIGEELISHTPFSGKIEFSILKKTWSMSGKYGSKQVTLKDTDPIKLIDQFFDIIRK